MLLSILKQYSSQTRLAERDEITTEKEKNSMETADITIEFVCAREEMIRERIEDIQLDRYHLEHHIVSISPGRIPEGHDECDLPDYRQMHGLEEYKADARWDWRVPEGCTSYVAHVRLQDPKGIALTRERILAIPFGDCDLGFAIGHISEAC